MAAGAYGRRRLRAGYARAGLVRERLQAGVPRAGRVGVYVRLIHLLDDPAEELAPVVVGRLELGSGALAKAPVEVELLLEDAEVDRCRNRRRPFEEARAESLAQRDRVVSLRDGREEAPVELDRLELDLARDALHGELVGSVLDRLDVERGRHPRQVGDVRLHEHGAGKDSLREQPSLLALVGVAGGAPEPIGELADQAVGAARAKRRRPPFRVEPADRVVPQAALAPHGLHRLGPGCRLALRAHRRQGCFTRRRSGPAGPAPRAAPRTAGRSAWRAARA